MSCTEKQARTRWCPFAAVAPGGKPREMRAPCDSDCCIGPDCMAWRWTDKLTEGPDAYRSEPGPTGYCGLAGPPNMGVMI